MYRSAIHYKGVWLAPGSEAFELYKSSITTKFEKLDKLLSDCDKAKRKLEGR